MNSKRIIDIASLVSRKEIVLDVGTDHGYLPIYLLLNNISPNVIASDISIKALDNAKNNSLKYNAYNNIKFYCTDGLNNIHDNYDVLVISGLGTRTIKRILSSNNLPDKIILESNNSHYELRKFMMNHGFKIDKEIISYENGKYYPIIRYIKGKELLDDKYLYFGKSGSVEYYNFLYEKYSNILEKIPSNKNFLFKKYLSYLDELMKENR